MESVHETRGRRDPDTDGGWAWVVLLSSSMGGLIAALMYIPGVINVSFLQEFGESRQATAWMMSIHSSLFSLAAPLSSLIIKRLGCRWTMIVGGLISSFGYVMTYFAQSFLFTFVSYGIIAGTGFGIYQVPMYVVISLYFVKYRNLAYGMICTATGIGTMILPIVISTSIEQFGWRGSMLIMAGITIQLFVCGAVLRPKSTLLTFSEDLNNSCNFNQELHYEMEELHQTDTETDEQLAADIQESDLLTVTVADRRMVSTESPLNTNHTHRVPIAETQGTNTPGSLRDQLRRMCNRRFISLCASFFVANGSAYVAHVHFPAYFVEQGATMPDVTVCLIILGATNVLGRLTVAVSTSSEDVDVFLVYISSCGFTGVVLLVCPALSLTYGGRVTFSVLFGLYGAMYISVVAPVTIAVVGLNLFPLAHGIVFVFGGFGSIIGPVLAGFSFDITDTYTYGFILAGCGYLLAAVLLMLVPIARTDPGDKRGRVGSLVT